MNGRRVFFLDSYRFLARIPLKAAILAGTVLFVCFPFPRLAIRHVRHWTDPNALIEPDSAALRPWVEELRPMLATIVEPKAALKTVEKFVYQKVPYDWDWNTWGLSDYLPTVDEVIAKGREDCDGRAVVAASLLANFGFKARIVTDFAHVWVQTDKGETMSPGKRKAVTATDQGMKVDWKALGDLPNVLGYGVAVFPWPREAIILLVAWWLMLDRRATWRRAAAGAALLTVSLILIRWAGDDYWNPNRWVRTCGIVLLAVTTVGMVVVGWRSSRRGRAMSEVAATGGME